MIASLRGTVVGVEPTRAVVEVSGVGYEFYATPTTLSQLREGEPSLVHTSMVVREDSITLFGFSDSDEKAVFDVLQTVSGVGPKLALAILATLTPDALRTALATGDVAALTRVSGVGKKSAQRLVLEIGSKLGPARGGQAAPAAQAGDVTQALVGLGWKESEAEAAVAEVEAQMPGASVPDLLRAALQYLGAKK